LSKSTPAVERTVATFMSAIDRMMGEAVAPQYILERVLLQLCEELTKRIDGFLPLDEVSFSTLKLSNALADYRDSRWEERD
jgi:hypothetical protein